ncbi:hypothetical protein ZIOFF_061905 [Zingiber officinale]|uniref:dUTP diphosphatase n=1 Tax=Zingiber officinale TaxID=94328 RepID=A0A8J5EZN9_ZINOF|nr:hypothetical protein ZIOFF_061905 [Zingiber officinale]
MPSQRRFRCTIESQISPEGKLDISRSRRAGMVPTEILYSAGFRPTQHRVYQHYSEEDILCIKENKIDLPLVAHQSHQALQEAGFHHIHMGLVMIRVYALHKRNIGAMILIVLLDTRLRGARSIIATMEMDLTRGTQMMYVIPDLMMSVQDFSNHVEISIQTYGYTEWQMGSNYLPSRGVIAIPGTRFTTEELRQQRWILRPSARQNLVAPTRMMEITSPDGEILAMIMEESQEALYVIKLDQDAILPKRKTTRAAGIAPHSGVAWQKGIQVGAGVIDNDFRGEVKILDFNMTYGNIVLNKGEAIAQLILEKIATPEVVLVVELPQTIRGDGCFGSTTT